MSTLHPLISRALKPALCLLLGMSPLFSQTTHTWTGTLNYNWNATANWDTGSIPLQGDYLIFTGDNNYDLDGGLWNDIPLSGDPAGLHPIRLRRITFDENASAFTLGGETLRVGGWIYNDSDHVQTISVDELQIVNGGGVIPNSQSGTAEGLVVDVGWAGMVIHSNITTSNTGWNFVKDGSGVLTLTGNNVTYGTIVNEGGLIQDGGSLGVGANSRLVLGSGWTMGTPDEFASAYVEYTGGATGSFVNIIARRFSGTNVVRVDGGSTVTVSGLLVNAGNTFPSPAFSSYTTDGQSILLFDLTGGGEVVLNQAGYGELGMLGQHVHYVLVQESTVDGAKTGFGYVDTGNGNRLTRATDYLTALPEDPNRTMNGNVNYVTSGHAVSGEVNFGRIVGNTLTIRPNSNPLDSTGSLTSWNGSNHANGALRITSLLMEEGTGDYEIRARWEPLPAIQRNTAYIYQYSTDGTLYFMRGFAMSGNTNVRIVKTGPGTVVYHKDGVNSVHQTLTDIQGGRFVLDGYHGSVEYFYVR